MLTFVVLDQLSLGGNRVCSKHLGNGTLLLR